MKRYFSFIILTIVMIMFCLGLACCGSEETSETKKTDGEEQTKELEKTKDDLVAEWLKTSDAYDYNNDNKINYEDYDIYKAYKEWKQLDDSYDYNNDHKIDYKDYDIYKSCKEWRQTDDAYDYNKDQKIDYKDYNIYKAYKEWKQLDDAVDYNMDRKIDYEDYELTTFSDVWIESSYAKDYNSDEKIDEEDFEFLKLYLKWKNSEEAKDCNGDKTINEIDYTFIYNANKWLNSKYAKDINGDDKIDTEDYILVLNFGDIVGNYVIINFSYPKDSSITLFGNSFTLKDIYDVTKYSEFEIKLDGSIKVTYPEKDAELLGDDKELVDEILSELKIKKLSETLYSVTSKVVLTNGTEIVIPLYLERKVINNTIYFDVELSVTINSKQIDISFNLNDKEAISGNG